MANIPTSKRLLSATPTVLTDSRLVQSWDVVIELTSTDPKITPPIVREYPYTWDVAALEKTPEEFTKEDVLTSAPVNLDDIFTSQYQSTVAPILVENLTDWSFD